MRNETDWGMLQQVAWTTAASFSHTQLLQQQTQWNACEYSMCVHAWNTLTLVLGNRWIDRSPPALILLLTVALSMHNRMCHANVYFSTQTSSLRAGWGFLSELKLCRLMQSRQRHRKRGRARVRKREGGKRRWKLFSGVRQQRHSATSCRVD